MNTLLSHEGYTALDSLMDYLKIKILDASKMLSEKEFLQVLANIQIKRISQF